MKIGLFLAFFILVFSTSVLAQVTYNGNGNGGFGGAVGGSSLSISDNGTTVTVTFTKGSGDFNDNIVMYIDNGSNGRSIIDSNVNDQDDDNRRAISSAGSNASDITLPSGFEATHAIAIEVGFGGLWSIPSTGTIGDNGLGFEVGVGSPTLNTSPSFTFNFDWSDIGLTGSDDFKFVITYLNGSNGFLSNEGYGDGLPDTNPGADNVTFDTYFEYPSGNILGQVITTNQNGDWSNSSTWTNGIVPNIGDNIGINHDVTLDQNAEVSDITISSGNTLTSESGQTRTLTIQDGGTFNNNGSFTANDGAVSFPGTGTITGTTSFNDVDIAGGVDFGTNSTINGDLIIEPNGAVVTNPPQYSDTSTLIYSDNNQVYGRSIEWSSTTGSGYPNNVKIQDNTTLDLGANGGNDTPRKIAGNLTIDSGSTLSLKLQPMSQALTVIGSFTNNGIVDLSSISGGDLKVQGNFEDKGTFNYNSRALFFEGSADQSITTSADPYTIDVLRINKSAGEVKMKQDIIIDKTGDPLQMSLQSILSLNGHNLTIGKDGANSQVSFTDDAALKVSDQSDLILKGNGDMGDLKFDGSTDRTTNKIRYVEIDRGSGDVNLGNRLYLKESIKLTIGTLNSGENLTFISNENATAQVEEVPSGGGNISGDVIVERFVPKSNRAFRYISSPVNTTETINDNLQEGATTADTNPNPNPGFGTHITGGIPADGFDATQTGNPSMFEWDEANQEWDEIPNTDQKKMNVGEAYALMVRGDRSTPLNSNDTVGPATTLRFTGNLEFGDQLVAASNLSDTSGNYNLIANPYQAIVDAKTLLESGDATDLDDQTIYVYDPTLGSQGGYAAIDISKETPSATPEADSLNTLTTDANEFILPNQAFFVETVDINDDNNINPSLTFKETYKNTGANFVDTFSDDDLSEMHINLKRQPEDVLVDGVTARFNPNHTNAVNNADADEVWNFDEWVALFNSDNYLSIEKRATPMENDTIQIYTGNYQSDSYVWQIDMSNIDREAVLVDAYLDTETPLNADNETNIAFDIDSNIPASTDPFRFSIRFTDETLAVDDPEKANFAVYPNPVTNNRFSISGLAGNGDTTIQLFDMTGKLVFTTTKSAKAIMTIDINRSLQTGVYQLSVSQDQAHYESTLIIAE